MTWIKNDEVFCNFKAPEAPTGVSEVLFPLSAVESIEAVENVFDITIEQMFNVYEAAELEADATLNLDAHQQVTAGALVLVKFTADDQGAKILTIGTGINGAAAVYNIPSEGTLNLLFSFNGTDFDLLGAATPVVEELNSESQTPAYAATIAATVKAKHTVIDPATLTGNATINLTIDSNLKAGATLLVKSTCDSSNRTITWGTKFVAPALVGVASKTHHSFFVFDGTNFCITGTPLQID